MAITDARRVAIERIPAPPVGTGVVDSQFGHRVWRVSDMAAENGGGAGIVPMYTGTQAWNSDESLMILYEQARGWRLHRGQPPFSFLGMLQLIEPPSSPELVHWSTTEPYVLRYLSGTGKIRRADLLAQTTDVVYDFQRPVLMESHFRPSWNDRLWGVGYWTDATRTNKRLVVVDTETSEKLLDLGYQDLGGDPVHDKGTNGVPIISPDGERCIIFVGASGSFLVINLTGPRFERLIGADWTFEHQALGKLSFPDLGVEADIYYSKTQGKNIMGTPPGILLACNAEAGYYRPSLGIETSAWALHWARVKDASGIFPWAPPTGVHHSALAYRDTNWVASSMMAPAQPGLVYGGEALEPPQMEIFRTNIAIPAKERLCHHRSAHSMNPAVNDYWQEPHPCVSPSGKYIVFASDWSFDVPPSQRATKVDSWIVETSVDAGN